MRDLFQVHKCSECLCTDLCGTVQTYLRCIFHCSARAGCLSVCKYARSFHCDATPPQSSKHVKAQGSLQILCLHRRPDDSLSAGVRGKTKQGPTGVWMLHGSHQLLSKVPACTASAARPRVSSLPGSLCPCSTPQESRAHQARIHCMGSLKTVRCNYAANCSALQSYLTLRGEKETPSQQGLAHGSAWQCAAGC